MSALPESIAWWVGGALLLFWVVGAHNRLVRLRSAGLVAYAALDAALVRQLDYVQSRSSVHALAANGQSTDDLVDEGSLLSAVAQMTAMLASTRQRPLDAGRMAALGTSLHVLLTAWQRLHPDAVLSFDADGTLSRPAPLESGGWHGERASPAAPLAWPEPSPAAEISRAQFNLAVAHYNAAVRQFPAIVVAWAFRLRSAAPLL